jgi:RsiW-degrading membrane proteinase PrsW (M82 family)
MSELQITYNGQLYTFAPGATVRIGRSSDNDVVVNDPTVSRMHARLSFGPSGWVWQNAGQAPTFLSGQPVAQFGVGQVVDVCLASPQGPALRLAAAAAQQNGPIRTEVAGAAPGAGAAAAAVAGAAGLAGQQAPGYAPAGAPGFAQGAQPAPAPGVPQQGYGPGAGVPPQGYGPGAGVPQQGFGPGAQPAGYPQGPATPGMPGYPGFAGQPGIPLAQLDQGSFFSTLIPVKSWLHDRGWRQGIRLLIIPYALLPLAYLQIFENSTSLTTPGWAYSLYVAPIWLIAFWSLIRPPAIGKTEVIAAGAIIVLTIILIHVLTIPLEEHWGNPKTASGALVIGYAEEVSKALPVLIVAIVLLFGFKRKLDPRTWFLLGTVAGLAFGLYEQAEYTKMAIGIINQTRFVQVADQGVLSFAFRVFVDGFQHAVWAGVSGFFIGIAMNYRRRAIPLLLLGVSIPALLHAFNDWSLSNFHSVWPTVAEQALSLLLFLGYTLSASTITQRVRRNPNFRGQSIMMERFSEPEQAT